MTLSKHNIHNQLQGRLTNRHVLARDRRARRASRGPFYQDVRGAVKPPTPPPETTTAVSDATHAETA